MKLNNTILKAAIERHNERVDQKHKQEVEVQVKRTTAMRGGDALLKKVQKLHQQVKALSAEAGAAQLDITYASNPSVSLPYQERNRIEKSIPMVGYVTLDQVLLMAAHNGGDDVAKVLDDLKLDWRPTT